MRNQVSLGFLVILTIAFVGDATPTAKDGGLNLVLLHNNDIHGRFEETARNSGSCPDSQRYSCLGGIARTAHVIRNFRKAAKEGGPPVLYLNAGDTFVGTSWFSVFTWNISATLVNLLEPDAMSLGNHEFDLTASVLSPFVKAVKAPVLAANLDFSSDPSLSGIKKSVVLNVDGHKVGVIGYLTPETIKISAVGSVAFEDEVDAIAREAAALKAQGVNIIIAVGHAGFQMDQTIAQEVELVDVVVGGHTNTFLWNGPQPDSEVIEGPYPTVITQASGKKVPVVQAYAYTKYLGVLNLTFNANGDLTHFEGQPLLMETEIPQEHDVLEVLESYRPAIEALNKQIVGTSKVLLDATSTTCRSTECNFANLVTDAMVQYVAAQSAVRWTDAPIGLINGGGIRNTVTPEEETGNVTRGDLLGAFPFGNLVVVITLKGSDLLAALEQMLRSNGETSLGEFPQVSGLKLVIDNSKPAYSRVASLKVRCGACDIPSYEDFDIEKNYTIVTTSFLQDGGDGVTILNEKAMDKKVQDLGLLDVLVWYFQKFSPVYSEVQGRISFVEKNKSVDHDKSVEQSKSVETDKSAEKDTTPVKKLKIAEKDTSARQINHGLILEFVSFKATIPNVA